MLPGRHEGPRVDFTRYGRCIAKQAPIVGDYCNGRPCSERWCPDRPVVCPFCRGLFCRRDYQWHFQSFVVPRDSWRTIRRHYRVYADTLIRERPEAFEALPKVVGSYCKTPDRRGKTASCGYESVACQGAEASCLRCKFPYCAHHLPEHVVRMRWPRKVLQGVLKQYRDQLDEIVARKRKLLRVHVPHPRKWA